MRKVGAAVVVAWVVVACTPFENGAAPANDAGAGAEAGPGPDGGGGDASLNRGDASPGDASTPIGFTCAGRFPKPNYCNDFDEAVPENDTSLCAGGTLASAPGTNGTNALRASVPANVMGCAYHGVDLSTPYPVESVSWTYDFFGAGPISEDTELPSLYAEQGTTFCAIQTHYNLAAATIVLREFCNDTKSDDVLTTFAVPGVQNAWFNIAIALDLVTKMVTATVTLPSAPPLPHTAQAKRIALKSPDSGVLLVGVSFTPAETSAVVTIDNFAASWR